ncbi:MAG TPA: ubiquinol-cytochrome c reductase cytochrome b subunit [Acidimicrobiales bacterium]|nr:ubiquinol-cytochrome c reductase cytochrome b subunit [Acidimicrobiales bacterium]
MIDRLYRFFDSRLRIAKFTDESLDKVFPDNFTFMFGELALYAFLVLLVTGVYLTFFFHPSGKEVVYHGHYMPLNGVHVSEAFASTLHISFDVRAGLVIRQIHHWAALVFVGAIVVHLCRVFFTGAFRRPREVNWMVGVTLLVLAILNGFAGYSMPDDLLSGTGLRIANAVLLSIPVVGSWLAFLVFGGEFPQEAIIPRLFVVHVFVVPLLILGLIGAHLGIMWRQKHTQFAGPGRSEDNVVGSRLWPTYAARSIGLVCGVFAVCAALGAFAQINPVWLYGPYRPAATSTAAQPDWYMGWLEGALRLFPGWRIHAFGFSVSEVFWPAVVLPSVTFGLLYAWPFLEQRLTGEGRRDHHLLNSPRDRPVRTAVGAATLTFYGVLFVAGSQDIIATKLNVAVPDVTFTLRVLVLALPVVVYAATWRLCRELQHVKRRVPAVPPVAPASSPGPVRRSWLRGDGSLVAVVFAFVAGFAVGRRSKES